MAKRDSYLKLIVRAEFEEKTVCAYEDGDETFHTIHHGDACEASTFQVFKRAWVEVYSIFPAEKKLLKEFNDLVASKKDAFYALRDSFSEFYEFPKIEINTSRVEFCEEERKLGELDLTEEEYDQLKADKDFFSKRGTFVICYNGKNFNGLAIAGQPGFNSKFNWEQLRSEWHPKEISGILREDWDYLKNRDYSLFEDLLEASLSELM